MIATALKVTVLVIIFTFEISSESHIGPHIRVKRAETKKQCHSSRKDTTVEATQLLQKTSKCI